MIIKKICSFDGQQVEEGYRVSIKFGYNDINIITGCVWNMDRDDTIELFDVEGINFNVEIKFSDIISIRIIEKYDGE